MGFILDLENPLMFTPQIGLVAKTVTTSVYDKDLSPSTLVECSVVHLYMGPIVIYIV